MNKKEISMKYILLIFDGMADTPSDFKDLKTPIVNAKALNMKKLAKKGIVGTVKTTPDGMQPGSDVTNMGILGYDPQKYYKGRGAIEAAALGIKMSSTDVAYRTNLISTDGIIMLDSSADHITDAESYKIIDTLNQEFSNDRIKFYPGVSYRHILIIKNGSMNVKLYAPYKFVGKRLDAHKPSGDLSQLFWDMIVRSKDILENHPINIARKANNHLPANQIWFWAEGQTADFDSFQSKFGKKGAVIAGVDLIKGLGYMTGLDVKDVPGATGYIDTNYQNKAKSAIDALDENDFVWIHVEAPDEAGHERNESEKIKAIENIDNIILSQVISALDKKNEEYRILIMPDHPTPISTGSHNSEPVPFILYDSRTDTKNNIEYNETDALKSDVKINNAFQLMDMLLSEK